MEKNPLTKPTGRAASEHQLLFSSMERLGFPLKK
jgi:hypothetical protein